MPRLRCLNRRFHSSCVVESHANLKKLTEDANITAADLASKHLEVEQATAANTSLHQQLHTKQQELQQLQQNLEAATARSDQLQETLDEQTAHLEAVHKNSSEARQRLQANLEAQLKQVTGEFYPL